MRLTPHAADHVRMPEFTAPHALDNAEHAARRRCCLLGHYHAPFHTFTICFNTPRKPAVVTTGHDAMTRHSASWPLIDFITILSNIIDLRG